METSTATLIITCVLSSTVLATLVKSGTDLLIAKFNRKNKLEDDKAIKEDRLTKLETRVSTLEKKLLDLTKEIHDYIEEHSKISRDIVRSNKLIMQSKIEHLATKYIHQGEISHENRKMLHEMWDEYHHSWKGNGDLDLLMSAVDELPLKH